VNCPSANSISRGRGTNSGVGVSSGVAVGSGMLVAAGALVGATVDEAAGADSLDEPQAAVKSARRTALTTIAIRLDRRHGPLFSCAEIRCCRVGLNVRNIGFAPPCRTRIENQPAVAD